jgi:hypothetical protein
MIGKRQTQSGRVARQHERTRNLWRAALASVLILLALSTGFFAGAHSDTVMEMFSAGSKQEALAASSARRSELRSGTILFTLPDGMTCRPMAFDNQTGEMRPGSGVVPCGLPEPNAPPASALTKFSLNPK